MEVSAVPDGTTDPPAECASAGAPGRHDADDPEDADGADPDPVVAFEGEDDEVWADGEELAAPSWPPPPSPVSAWATPPLANTAPMPSVIAPALSHVNTPNGRRTPQP